MERLTGRTARGLPWSARRALLFLAATMSARRCAKRSITDVCVREHVHETAERTCGVSFTSQESVSVLEESYRRAVMAGCEPHGRVSDLLGRA